MEKLIVIAGATASGKTAAAVRLAQLINGEIINSDSMQVYKYMDIGTAKVTDEEKDGIVHHMIDIVSPELEYSVAEYVVAAKKVISDVVKRGKVPILSGGTGLYIESLIYPFDFSNADKNADIRRQLEEELKSYGAEYMYKQLCNIDPIDAAKMHPNNTKRIIRALEIYRTTGKVKSQNSCERIPLYDLEFYCINREREELYSRIDRRVDIMFEKGLLSEVDSLINQHNLNFDMQSMQAIGYKEFRSFYEGKADLNEVKENIRLDSRHYAKRQLTWLRRYDFAQWVTAEELIAIYR